MRQSTFLENWQKTKVRVEIKHHFTEKVTETTVSHETSIEDFEQN